MTTAALPERNWLMPLNAVLAVVCTVLFLLAIEQRQALDVWHAVRSALSGAVERTSGWLDDGAGAVSRLASARPAPVAPDPADRMLDGVFAPEPVEGDDAAPGGIITFQRQEVRFESGAVLRTRPLRITTAGEARVEGRTLADRLNTVAEAQIEWRLANAPLKEEAEAAAHLCNGAAPERMAILHRTGRVDLLLFPAGPEPLEAMAAPCGEWRLRAR